MAKDSQSTENKVLVLALVCNNVVSVTFSVFDFIRPNPRLADSELSRYDEDAAGLGAFDSAIGGGDQKVEGSVAVYVSQSG